MLLLKAEGSKVDSSGVDRCNSCLANMDLALDKQQHSENCPIGEALGNMYHVLTLPANLSDTQLLLQAMEWLTAIEN